MWSELLIQKTNRTRQNASSTGTEPAETGQSSGTGRELLPAAPASTDAHVPESFRSSINVVDFVSNTNVPPVVMGQPDGAHDIPTDSDQVSFKSCFESRSDPTRDERAQEAAGIIAAAVSQEAALSSHGPNEQAGRRLRRELGGQMDDSEDSSTGDLGRRRPSIPDRVASAAPKGTAVGIIPDTMARLGDARRSVEMLQSPITQSEAFPAIVVSSPEGTEGSGEEISGEVRRTKSNKSLDDERQHWERPATPTKSVRSLMCKGMTYLHRCPRRPSFEDSDRAVSTGPLTVHSHSGQPNQDSTATAQPSQGNKAPSSTRPAGNRRDLPKSKWRKLAGTLWAKTRLDVLFEKPGKQKNRGRSKSPRQYHGYPGWLEARRWEASLFESDRPQ